MRAPFFPISCWMLAGVIASGFLWAQDMGGASPAAGLVVACEEGYCVTDMECGFVLTIPSVLPSRIALGTPPMPEYVTLLAASKEVSGDGRGTTVRLLLSFARPGAVQLPPLALRVDGIAWEIPFAPLEVFQNPQSLLPVVELELRDAKGNVVLMEEDGSLLAIAGEPLAMRVSLCHATALKDMDWQLVPDALFHLQASYQEEFQQEGEASFSLFRTAAEFSLVPLRGGQLLVPPITLEVVGAGGTVHHLEIGPLVVHAATVQPAASGDGGVGASLGEAFFEPSDEVTESGRREISLAHAQRLAWLRYHERREGPWASSYQQRKALEEELGVLSSAGERLVLFGWTLVALAVAFSVAAVLVAVRHQPVALLLLLLVGGILCFGGSILYTAPLFRTTGILAASALRGIPEEDALGVLPVAPYSFVEVVREIPDWYYVVTESGEGWVLRDEVALVSSSGAGKGDVE